MTFISILLILFIIVYFISYNNRDKSKDYHYSQQNQITKTEGELIWDVREFIDAKIIVAKKQNLSTIDELVKYKAYWIRDIDAICKTYYVDRFTAKMIIDSAFDREISKFDESKLENDFKDDIYIKLKNELSEIFEEYNSTHAILEYLKGIKPSYVDMANIYSKKHAIAPEKTLQIVEKRFSSYIKSFSDQLRDEIQ